MEPLFPKQRGTILRQWDHRVLHTECVPYPPRGPSVSAGRIILLSGCRHDRQCTVPSPMIPPLSKFVVMPVTLKEYKGVMLPTIPASFNRRFRELAPSIRVIAGSKFATSDQRGQEGGELWLYFRSGALRRCDV